MQRMCGALLLLFCLSLHFTGCKWLQRLLELLHCALATFSRAISSQTKQLTGTDGLKPTQVLLRA